MSSNVLSARGIGKTVKSGTNDLVILREIDLEVTRGEAVAVVGASGSGKSTLLALIGGLRRLQQGYLEVLGRSLEAPAEATLTALRRDIGVIFQDHHLFDALTPRETLRLAMRLKAERYGKRDFRSRPVQWLERVGLGARLDVLPATLSTGQRQCVAVARALVNEPALILADEPTASLDAASAATALECLREAVRERRAAVLMVTHDSRLFAAADRVVTLRDGRVVESSAAAAATRVQSR